MCKDADVRVLILNGGDFLKNPRLSTECTQSCRKGLGGATEHTYKWSVVRFSELPGESAVFTELRCSKRLRRTPRLRSNGLKWSLPLEVSVASQHK